MRTVPRFALPALALILASCGPAAPGVPVPVSDDEISVLSALLEAEDRRGDPDSVIAPALAHPHPLVRRHGALTAGRLASASHVPALAGLLADPDTSVAATAAFSLGRLGDAADVAALIAQLDPAAMGMRPTVASEAVSALGRLGHDAGRAPVVELLRATPGRSAREREVVGAALLALWRFDPRVEPSEVDRWLHHPEPALRWRAVYALARRPNAAATAALLERAGDRDPLVRSLSLRGLTAELADSAGVPPGEVRAVLEAALRDTDPRVRVRAARTLGTFGAVAVRPLASALGDDQAHVEVAVVEALGRSGSSEAAPYLLNLLEHPEVQIRSIAFASLVVADRDRARSVAEELARSDSWRMRAAVAGAFAGADGMERVTDLLLGDDDARVRAAAVGALGRAAQPDDARALARLVQATGEEDAPIRAAALEGLGRIGGAAALPVLLDGLVSGLDDPHPRAALAALGALHALQEGGVPVARSIFRRVSAVPDPLVRQRAADLFGETASRAWGAAYPTDPVRPREEYRAVVQEFLLHGERALRARIETERGDIVVFLFGASAPLTVENFVRLAESGYFQGQEWPRVVPNFVIQGGDPRGDTSGGPGYTIRDEINRHRYARGTVGMALAGPDTGGSQFFITHAPQPHLDGGYTVFGAVTAGMDVVDRVLVGDRIHRIVIERD